MKKFIYTVALNVLLWSCGGGGGSDTPPPAPENHVPTTPTLVYPTNNLLCIENPVECKWNTSTDSDAGDVITYQIEVAENSAFTQGKQTFNGTSLTQLVPLLEDVAFYWRVKATDSENASSSYSSVYKFYTYGEGIENHLPFSPELIAPELNSLVVGTSAILQWTANDVDTADVLTYDVYLGTDDGNLPLVSADLSATSFITPTLTASETYYWRVEVKDGAGGQTIGQTWSFITD